MTFVNEGSKTDTCPCMVVEETSPDQFSSFSPKGSSGWWKVRSMVLRYTDDRLKRTVINSLRFMVHSGAGEESTVKHLPLVVSFEW